MNGNRNTKTPKNPELFGWQKRARNDSIELLVNKKSVLIHATPGGGKTVCALSIAKELMDSWDITHIIVLVPTRNLVKQWSLEAEIKFGICLKDSVLYRGTPDYGDWQGICMTYAGMHSMFEHLRMFCGDEKHRVLIIADEIHHVGDKAEWGGSFKEVADSAEKILSLTGTPWGSSGQRIPYVEYEEFKNEDDVSEWYAKPDFIYSKVDAIQDQVCRTTSFIRVNGKNIVGVTKETGEVEEYESLSDAHSEKKRYVYSKSLESIDHMRAMFEQADAQLQDLRNNGVWDAAGLVIAPNIRAARKFRDEIYFLTGAEPCLVTSEDPESQDKINAFRHSKERWIVAVDMVSEGVDIKRLMVNVFLSGKNTELYVRQAAGRIERMNYPRTDTSKQIPPIHKGCYFYHTDWPDLNEIIEKLHQENVAGLALLEEEKRKSEENIGEGLSKPRNGFQVNSVDSEISGVMVNGILYSAQSLGTVNSIKNNIPGSSEFPLDMLLAITSYIQESNGLVQDNERRDYSHTQVERKKRLGALVQKRIIEEMSRSFKAKPSGDAIKIAHSKLNAMAGIFSTQDASMDQLERKLELINSTEPLSWLA